MATGLKSEIHLPQSDVLKFHFIDGSWIAVRPSGTEPKIKFYYSVVGENEADARGRFEVLQRVCQSLV